MKKNVTIPQGLDILAKENNVNYSAAMVRGIKMALGITDGVEKKKEEEKKEEKKEEKSISFTTFMKKMIEFWDTEVE